MENNAHGGNIYKKAKELGIRKEEILDFSANISPLGLPEHIRKAMVKAVDGIINYPDPDCTDLREAIGRRDGVDPSFICCGNGGADLLYRAAFALRPKRVLLPVPAFVEYEAAFTAAGAEIIYEYMDETLRIPADLPDRITEDIDLVIVCNPNNPTGLLTEREALIEMLNKAGKTGTKVLVDECFLEICREEERYTLRSFIGTFPHLLILKSFTKLYAMPGVRLGYLLCGDREVIAGLNRTGQAWSVSHIAQCAGLSALSKPEYRENVIDVVETEAAYMKEALSALPIKLYDGRANYLFFQTPGLFDLDRRLEKRGILIRNCSNYVNLGDDSWRVAVRSHEDNRRLIRELYDIFKNG